MDEQLIKDILLASFPGSEIHLKDLTGGKDHWHLTIKAKEFKGLSLVEQHRSIYRVLTPYMNKEIHALAISSSSMD
jgi:stress-induced morphogen